VGTPGRSAWYGRITDVPMSISLSVPRAAVPAPAAASWARGRFVLRAGASAPVEIRRPFATIGRGAGADVVLDAPGVAARHVYLHLDRRGLFATDLATRLGSAVGPSGGPCGWLHPGEAVALAGRWVELLDLELFDPAPGGHDGADPLCDEAGPLPRVVLDPGHGASPLVLRSELACLGRASACGVRVADPALAPVHCVLVRAARGAFVANLAGRGARLDGRPLRGAAALRDGMSLAVGASRFTCRVRPAGAEAEVQALPPLPPRLAAASLGLPPGAAPPASALDGDADALVAWLLGALHAMQGELLRRQDAFRRDVLGVLRRLQGDHAAAVAAQLERAEALHRDLVALRREVRRRFGPASAPVRNAPPVVPAPSVSTEAFAPLPACDDAGATAAWLARRIGQVRRERDGRRGR
jgi:hypothetical protein